jgi:hypothetical protein
MAGNGKVDGGEGGTPQANKNKPPQYIADCGLQIADADEWCLCQL